MFKMFWNYIYILVLFEASFVSSTNFIHQIINGSISDYWNVNFTIFSSNFQGTILYVIDSNKNKLSVKVNEDFNSKKVLKLSYNNAFTRFSVSRLCGCEKCNDSQIMFISIMKNDTIHMQCNTYGEDSLKVTNSSLLSEDNIPQSILDKLKGQNNSIFLGMGNVDGTENLQGCLTSFYFNDTRIIFKKKGKEFLSTCQVKCTPKMCNKGKCGEKYPFGPICDCSLTPLNGRHCDRPLKVYKMGNRTSFQRKWTSKQIQFKLSWQQKSPGTYCLMDLIYKSGNFTLTINGDYLMKDSEVVTTVYPGEMNFINVNITDSRVIIKNNEKTLVLELAVWEATKINIGFSEKKTNCNLFVGRYDFNFNSSQLEKFEASTSVSIKVSITWILLIVFFLLLLISAIILIIFLQRRKTIIQNNEIEESSKLEFNETMELKDKEGTTS